jgi:multidrug efflux pump subunit AcrA (membrane-fusion protein)
VTLGRIFGGLRIVREGLKAGDVIVVDGAQRVHSGITVTPQRVAMGGDDSAAPAAPPAAPAAAK